MDEPESVDAGGLFESLVKARIMISISQFQTICFFTSYLRRNADNQEIGQLESVILDDTVLQGGNDGDSGVERIPEEEIAWYAA